MGLQVLGILKDMHAFDAPFEDVNTLMERENCELVRLANYLLGSAEAMNNTLKVRPLSRLWYNLQSFLNAYQLLITRPHGWQSRKAWATEWE